MKKIIYLVVLISILILVPLNVFAANQQQQQNQVQDPTVHSETASPQGMQVQNQNKVQTQNQGEDSMLQVSTTHMEMLNQTDSEIEELMEIKTTGPLGEQIKLLSQEQIEAQDSIRINVVNLSSRSKLVKTLIGPDYKAINLLKQEMEQNRLRIVNMQELKNQVYNQADATNLEEAISVLEQQNISLQEMLKSEESSFSLLGWLFRFLAK